MYGMLVKNPNLDNTKLNYIHLMRFGSTILLYLNLPFPLFPSCTTIAITI